MNTRIEQVVKKSGLTKAKFAERIGVSAPYVTMLCSGASNASDRTIQDICREFGVNEVWLRTGKGEPFKERSQEEKIMRFAVQTNKGSDDFRKAYVAMLAGLSDEGWKGLQEMYDKLSEIYKKSDRE